MKMSRSQRKAARAQALRSRQVAPVSVVAKMAATAAAPLVEAAPALAPVIEAVQVEEEAPLTDPVPWSVPIPTPTIPPAPDSHVRLVEPQLEEEAPIDQSEEIDEIKRERLFDQQILSLLPEFPRQRWEFCLVQLNQVTYYTELLEFLTRCTWASGMLYKLSVVNGVKLWYGRSPTSAGKDVWADFRKRVRRESALERIATNRIVGTEERSDDVAHIRPPSSKSQAA